MGNSQRRIPASGLLVCAAVIAWPILTFAQGQPSAEERAKIEAEARAQAIARNARENARQLTLFDRQGKVVAKVGERALYNQPVLSPDVTRVAVIKSDPVKETTSWQVRCSNRSPVEPMMS